MSRQDRFPRATIDEFTGKDAPKPKAAAAGLDRNEQLLETDVLIAGTGPIAFVQCP